MDKEPKKEAIPAKVREEMQRGISQRKAISYTELKKGDRK